MHSDSFVAHFDDDSVHLTGDADLICNFMKSTFIDVVYYPRCYFLSSLRLDRRKKIGLGVQR